MNVYLLFGKQIKFLKLTYRKGGREYHIILDRSSNRKYMKQAPADEIRVFQFFSGQRNESISLSPTFICIAI